MTGFFARDVILVFRKGLLGVDDPESRFTRLYDGCYRSVLGYALLRVEQQAAEDVAGETFLIAWRRLADVPEPPLPWLLGVARNLLRKQYAAGRRGEALVTRLAELARTIEGDVAERVAEREAALAVLAGMPERDVEAVILASWYGLTPRQAARVAGTSARAFTVRLSRARRRLADALNLQEHLSAGPRTLQEQR